MPVSAPGLLYVTQVAPYGVEGEERRPAGVHGTLGQSAEAVAELASLAGLTSRTVEDVGQLGADELSAARVLGLFTIGETPWSAAQRRAVVEAVRAGSMGIFAVHAATDSSYGWPDFGALVGARFDGHPWTQDFTVEVPDPTHPAVAGLGESFAWRDEVYLFRDLRPDATVLLRARQADLDLSVPGGRRPPIGFPLAWCHTEGRGRCFYSALGHFPGAWEAPFYLRALAGALSWVAGSGPAG